MGPLGGDGVRQPGRHGGQVARQIEPAVAPDVEVTGRPGGDRPRVRGQDGVVGGQPVDHPHEVLGLDRVAGRRPPGRPSSRASRPCRLRRLEEAPVGVARRAAAAGPAATRAASPTSGHLGRDPVADARGVDLDLHHLGRARRREVLGVREVGPDHEQRVGLAPWRPPTGGCRAGRSPPVVSGWSSGTTALPGRVLTIGLPSALGHRQHLVPGAEGAGAGQEHDLGAGVEHVGRPLRGHPAAGRPGAARRPARWPAAGPAPARPTGWRRRRRSGGRWGT